ncbi:MAG: hypothetical protein ACI8RD_008851, partial [Bacillariaceae sp.]
YLNSISKLNITIRINQPTQNQSIGIICNQSKANKETET